MGGAADIFIGGDVVNTPIGLIADITGMLAGSCVSFRAF